MKPSLDISIFGSSLLSAYWNGAATYYRGIVRALAARGHRITFYEPDAYDRQSHRDLDDPPWCEVIVYSGTVVDDVYRTLERAAKSDVLVKASGVGVWDEVLEYEIARGAGGHALNVFWDVDAPATLDRLRTNPTDPLRALVPKFDVVFTYGGGPPVVNGYEALGARRCLPIYNAVDPTTHHAVAADPGWASDLSLLANRLPDREARIDEFFFQAARALPNRRFLLGGNGWFDAGLPPNVRAVGHVYTADHNVFNASATAVLNVARDSMAACGWSPATRIFEAAGAGACIITDAWPGIDDFLEPGRELLLATSGEDVTRHLRDLHSSQARAIGMAARKRVLAEHTYARRARDVERVLLAEDLVMEVRP